MSRIQKRKWAWIIGSSAVALLLVIGLIVTMLTLTRTEAEPDPFLSDNTSVEEPAPEEEATVEETPEPEELPAVEEEAEPEIDPASVSAIDSAPLGVTVSYVRGVPGFEFQVKRTAASTQYVDFSSEELVGSKCTEDEGVFATILKNPTADESATLTTKKTLNENIYGLALPEATCTGDAELFARYQSAFEDAFGLLAELPTSD